MNRLAWMLLHASVLPSTSVAIAHCSHFADFSVLCLYEHFAHSALATPSPLHPFTQLRGQGTHLFYRSHYARYHIPFFHNNGPWSSGVDSRLSSRCQHISVIYIDKVNGMECVCAPSRCWLDSTRLDFNSSTDFDSNLPFPWFHVQKFAFLATTSHATPGSCIQRVALKGSPQNVPLFMSSALRAHMQFLWLVSHRNGLLLKALPPPPPSAADKQAAFLPFPFFFWRCFSFFFG